MGEKFGRDSIWESHLATELWSTKIPLEAVLDEQKLTLREVMDFKVGQTLMLNNGPDALVEMRCGGVPLASGRIGRLSSNVAVRIEQGIKKTNRTEAIEAAIAGAQARDTKTTGVRR
jgi:flagellar motor switch protein FliM